MSGSFDVVIPVRFGAHYLPEALRSVAAQATPAQVIVVDDGATVDLVAMVRSLEPELDSAGVSVRVVPNERTAGIGGARNTGVALGSASLVAFLDADDLWPAGRHLALTRLVETGPPGDRFAPAMVFGMVEQFRDGGGQHVVVDEPRRRAMVAGGMVMTRAAWERAGEFDEVAGLGEFIDWYARAKSVGVVELVADLVVLRRRLHDDNTTLHRKNERQEYLDVVRRHLRRRDAAELPRPQTDPAAE